MIPTAQLPAAWAEAEPVRGPQGVPSAGFYFEARCASVTEPTVWSDARRAGLASSEDSLVDALAAAGTAAAFVPSPTGRLEGLQAEHPLAHGQPLPLW